MTILLIDEDESWRTRAAAALYRRGYDVMSQTGRWRIAGMLDTGDAPDLVVLCSNYPAEDAKFSRLVAQWRPRPGFVLLCPTDCLDEREASLSAGADHCLAKPDDPASLGDVLDQIPPAVAASKGGWDEPLEFEGWRLHVNSACLIAPSGAAGNLVPGDAQLLQAFLARPGRILSQAQLHQLCGIDDQISERVLYRRVCRLRRTLRDLDRRAADLIRTVYGEGYVFIGGRACR